MIDKKGVNERSLDQVIAASLLITGFLLAESNATILTMVALLVLISVTALALKLSGGQRGVSCFYLISALNIHTGREVWRARSQTIQQ